MQQIRGGAGAHLLATEDQLASIVNFKESGPTDNAL